LLYGRRAWLEGAATPWHQKRIPVGDRIRRNRRSNPTLWPLRPRQREEGAGRVQGADLSQFLGQPASRPAAAVKFPKIDKELAAANPFAYLNFVLQFCPPEPEERALRANFASIGIEAGKPFDPSELSEAQRAALVEA